MKRFFESSSFNNVFCCNGLSMAALISLIACVILALPMADTCMQFHIGDLLKYGNDSDVFLLSVMLISFALQLWAEKRDARWGCRLILCISAAGLLLAEAIWLTGGWNRLLSSMLWALCFPMMLGAASAILLIFVYHQTHRVQIIAASLAIFLLAAMTAFWPRDLMGRIEVTPDARMLYFEPEGERDWMQARDMDELMLLLRSAKVMPCVSKPDWDASRGILLRLNEEYILVANHNESPYIYEYTGELERFMGDIPEWRVYSYPALYAELRTSANLLSD